MTPRFRSLRCEVHLRRPNSAAAKSSKTKSGCVFAVEKLVEAKKIALRRGIWFRVLNRVERGVLDLTVRYIDSIRSATLANVLTVILEKLKLASESIADRLVRTVGISLAQKASSIAVSWGNKSARKWAEDLAFARYLAFNMART